LGTGNGYWERIVHFHELMSRDYPGCDEGLIVVRSLYLFFTGLGCEELNLSHPLNNRLQVGSYPNYLWLEQYARKLITASSIKGFNQVAKRLCNTEEFLSANYEVEAALKLHLGGLEVSFLERSSTPTPDLLVNLGNTNLNVEVSSLNSPMEEMLMMNFVTKLNWLKPFEVAVGGYVNKVPSSKQLINILNQVNAAVNRVKKERKVKKLSFQRARSYEKRFQDTRCPGSIPQFRRPFNALAPIFLSFLSVNPLFSPLYGSPLTNMK
jgi:hypothetical protein